jgi:hypothetical protein
VLRRIFGLDRGEVIGELDNLYTSHYIVRMQMSMGIRWAGHVAEMRENRNACRILAGKPEGRRPQRKPRSRRWIILKWGGMD